MGRGRGRRGGRGGDAIRFDLLRGDAGVAGAVMNMSTSTSTTKSAGGFRARDYLMRVLMLTNLFATLVEKDSRSALYKERPTGFNGRLVMEEQPVEARR